MSTKRRRNRVAIHDPFNDTPDGFLYQKIGSAVDDNFLEELKTAAEGVGPAGYAWPSRMMFPIFSEKAAALSSWYAQEQSTVLPVEVQEKISEVMEFYGISEEILVPEIKEAAIDEDAFLFPEHKKVLVNSAEQVKAAEALLHQEGNEIPILTRTYGFRRLQVKAAEFDVELDPTSIPYLGEGRCKVADLCEELRKRRTFLADGEVKQAFFHLETQLRELKLEYLDDMAECDKLASFIHELDEEAGIEERYNRRGNLGFRDPVLAVFNQEKTASQFVNLAGNEVPLEDVAALDPSLIADVVGQEFLEDIQDDGGNVDPSEMAQVLNILPADMQQEIYGRLF